MDNSWILVLADDLTGALESGAKFSAQGLKTAVTVSRKVSTFPAADVLVIDTETRHLPESEAYETVLRTAQEASRFRPKLIYKKTDSTLRGHIGAEFRALRAVFPERSVVYVPALPELGRTVRQGQLLVWGTPVHLTEFALDALNPVHESNINLLLQDESVLIVDSESAREIDETARLVTSRDPCPIAAGPSALAGSLARNLKRAGGPPIRWPKLQNCLVVNGSRHQGSRNQLALAQERGCFGKGLHLFDRPLTLLGLSRAVQVGELVRSALNASSFDGIFVIGGDTAFGVHLALGCPDFHPISEVLPGVPLSFCGGLYWITKAGGFGAPDLLCRLHDLLIDIRDK